MVLLDVRCVDWDQGRSLIEDRSAYNERLVVVTDQPVIHLARDLRVVLEFVPSATHEDDRRFAEARLAEICRVYKVDYVLDDEVARR